jgi:hypothetical protein
LARSPFCQLAPLPSPLPPQAKLFVHRLFVPDSSPQTLHPRPFIPDSSSQTLHHRLFIPDSSPQTLHPRLFAPDFSPQAPHPRLFAPGPGAAYSFPPARRGSYSSSLAGRGGAYGIPPLAISTRQPWFTEFSELTEVTDVAEFAGRYTGRRENESYQSW